MGKSNKVFSVIKYVNAYL